MIDDFAKTCLHSDLREVYANRQPDAAFWEARRAEIERAAKAAGPAVA
ncbi:hypothetical protein [Micromonospora purpureochromogenes]|uniref:Uncharacterized protein n=1 Tax=Micromonospora purpureochromogenes TaxID=47872 RepID=A0ABX2RUZ4_9ACTN|nr:hypothetical protein [Micromonospora purpureochromogenes]NYF59918.1 hypothetical protein [Micromonospora purpureochromogenes]